MPIDDPETLVSTEWLEKYLGQEDLILHSSWPLLQAGRDAQAEYAEPPILGAQLFNIGEIADDGFDRPNMVLDDAVFEDWMMNNFGISNNSQIVVYDACGLFSAPWVWWLLRHMGLNRVAVLDGGLPKLRAEGHAIGNAPRTITRLMNAEDQDDGGQPERDRHEVADFTVHRCRKMVSCRADVEHACTTDDIQILDARPAVRFRGDAPEPRPGLRRGHIPGAINVPFTSLLNSNQTLKDPEDLRDVLQCAGYNFEVPAITYCGSGVTAAIINLALEIINRTPRLQTTPLNHSLYDGSWSEWGKE